jgi:hypothetical protein
MRTAHRKASHQKRRHQADPSSIYRLMAKVQPFTESERVALALPVRIAFDAIKSGQAQRDDFDTLAAMANICLVRSEEIDAFCVESAKRAQDALMRCLRRYESTGRWGFDGPAIQDIEIVIDFYEQLLEMSTPQQMKKAMLTVIERTNAKEVLQ